MSIYITIRNNLFSLAFAEILTKIFGMILYVLLARYLGPEELGVYSIAVSVVMICTLFSNFGIDSFIVREIAVNPTGTKNFFYSILVLKICGGIIGVLSVIVFSKIMNYEDRAIKAIMIFSLTLLISPINNFFDAIFRGHQKMKFSAFLKIGRSILTLCFICIVIGVNKGIYYIISTHVITAIFLFLITYTFIIRKYFYRLDFNASFKDFKTLLIGGAPFFFTGVIYIVNAKTDILMLSKFASTKSVGFYDAANNLFLVLMIIPSLISQVLYPFLAQQFSQKKENFNDVINFVMRVLTSISVPISIGIFFLSPQIIDVFYGLNYSSAAIILQILGSGLSIVFVRSILAWILAAINKTNQMMWINFLTLIVNVLLNFLLIPICGYIGAAIATIISMIFSTIVIYILINQHIRGVRNIVVLYFKPIIAGAPLVAFLYFCTFIHFSLLILIGMLIYCISFLLIGGFTLKEIIFIRKIFKISGPGKVKPDM